MIEAKIVKIPTLETIEICLEKKLFYVMLDKMKTLNAKSASMYAHRRKGGFDKPSLKRSMIKYYQYL